MWQDYVLTATSVAFIGFLIPMLRSAVRVPWWTAGPTSYCLAANAVVLYTLAMPFSALTALVLAAMWQRIATRRSDELAESEAEVERPKRPPPVLPWSVLTPVEDELAEPESGSSGLGFRVLVPSDCPPDLTIERAPD